MSRLLGEDTVAGRLDAVTDLARMHRADDLAFLDFVQTWGLMGYAHLDKPKRQGRKHADGENRGGDPVNWLRGHARTLQFCLSLRDRLSDLRALSDFLLASAIPTRTGQRLRIGGLAVLTATDATFDIPAEPEPGFSSGDYLIASELLAALINSNLATTPVGVRFDPLKGMQQGPRFIAPIQALYWGLASLLANPELEQVSTCEECGAYFIVHDKRQRFCPPWPGRNATQSQCAGRFRQRQRRNAIKQEQGEGFNG